MTTYREYPDVEQGTPEWDDLRRGMVTGSTITGLITTRYLGAEGFGCSECDAEPGDPCRSKVKRAGEYAPIKTFHGARAELASASRVRVIEPARDLESRSIAMLLTAERITGCTEPTWIGEEMWRGIEDEPRVRALYAEHYAPVREVGFMVRDLGPGWGIGYSPDGVVGDDGLIEIKSRRQKKHLATILSGEVPPENMAQLQAGLLVSGRAWIDYVSYCGGMPLWVRRVEPDPRWFVAIEGAVAAFEQTAAEMVRAYTAATEGLPATERVVEPEMSL